MLRSWPRAAAVLLLAATAAGGIHIELIRRTWPEQKDTLLKRRIAKVEARAAGLAAAARTATTAVAAWPETRRALAGDPSALAVLFSRLSATRDASPEHPALAVRGADLAVLAWAGRIEDRRPLPALAGRTRDVFVLAGSVSTTLVAVAPLVDTPGRLLGVVTAEVPLAVRRNIQNAFLADYDRLAEVAPGLELRYVDVLEADHGPRPFSPLGPGSVAREAVLRGSDGGVIAAVRAVAGGPDEALRPWLLFYRGLVCALGAVTLALWMAGPGPSFALRLAAGASALRLLFLLLGPPLAAGGSQLASPGAYASSLLGPLLRSPLDLALTTAWVAVLTALITVRALRSAPDTPTLVRGLLAPFPALAVAAAVLAGIADTVANSSVGLDSLTPVPEGSARFALQLALLLMAACGTGLLVAVFAWAGPWPRTWRARGTRILVWTAAFAAALLHAPSGARGLPIAPALVLLVGAATLGARASTLRDRLRGSSSYGRALAAVLGLAAVAALLAPLLTRSSEDNLRAQIEGEQARMVLGQPEKRQFVLEQAERHVDALQLLEETPAGSRPPLLEELAFAVWSATELAVSGLPSAIEIQDPSGTLVSRFALSLPAPPVLPPLPTGDQWEVALERLPVASAERFVLHARRRLTYHGQLHGAVHLYVADDLLALPVAGEQDPYTVLFRSAPALTREWPVELLAWDQKRALLLSTADRPPALDASLLARVRNHPSGLWTTLPIAGEPHHSFVFTDGRTFFALAYPRRGPARYVADMVEAVSTAALVSLVAIAFLLALRAALRRETFSFPSLARAVAGRFSLRLFVAFVGIAVLPLAVLGVVLPGFVEGRLRGESEAQALEMAAVAKKAVEDFAFFQRHESPGREPVTDAALVWVASLIRNDLDVFERGRLLASSKRELYASGLLPARVSATVFRTLAIEGRASALRPERIGGFSYQVVSVPLQIGSGPPAILAIPLALREREVQVVLKDLDRSIRLASILFLAVAAVLAHSMARRISGPVLDLTRATRLVAEGDLGARVSATSRDEFQALVASFNQMATDLEAQRRDLERSNRLAAWADMARQVAHEVKNPLTPIQLAAEHMRRVYSDSRADFPSTLEACTDTILKQVHILRGIVTEFSAFARPPALGQEAVDVAALLREVTRPYALVLPPGVTLSLELEEAPPVSADRRLLERAVVNLLENALQAVGDDGQVVLRLRRGDGRVEIVVVDSGPGLDAEAQARAFEPFFSTKTGGSGLGLPLVRKIAEDHGGGAELSSGPGQTRALLWLPAAPTGSGSTASGDAPRAGTSTPPRKDPSTSSGDGA